MWRGPLVRACKAAAVRAQVLRRLDNVDPGVKEFFAPAAKLVLESDDPQNAMCAALAALSGLLEVPKPRRCPQSRTCVHPGHGQEHVLKGLLPGKLGCIACSGQAP